VLIVGLVALYTYAARVIGPKVVASGTPAVTRSQWRWFALGIVLLWGAADWPVHDIGEQYLYFVHMAQHIVITLVVPPVMLLATPEWLARLVVGRGRVDAIVHRLARPVPAALAFNGLALLSHWQVIVNGASSNGLFHYGMHTALVATAVLFWIPVCGPFPELRISPPAQMVYLFVASIVPTVPGAWLTFANGAVYSVYDIPDRLWGLTVTSDQQIAGLLMKLGAGSYLWLLITIIFFKWAGTVTGGPERRREPSVLTFDQVQREFESHPPPRTEV
jgi:putative membrane protein